MSGKGAVGTPLTFYGRNPFLPSDTAANATPPLLFVSRLDSAKPLSSHSTKVELAPRSRQNRRTPRTFMVLGSLIPSRSPPQRRRSSAFCICCFRVLESCFSCVTFQAGHTIARQALTFFRKAIPCAAAVDLRHILYRSVRDISYLSNGTERSQRASFVHIRHSRSGRVKSGLLQNLTSYRLRRNHEQD